VIRTEPKSKLNYSPTDPVGYQLYDLFEGYFPKRIEEHVRNLNQTTPLRTLYAQIEDGEITKGQWALYSTVCFVGQVNNSGCIGFAENCPGLIVDAKCVIEEYGADEFRLAYEAAFADFLNILTEHRELNKMASGDALAGFWEELGACIERCDEKLFRNLEAECNAQDREKNRRNWFTDLEASVLEFVLANPHDFQAEVNPNHP